MQFLLNENFEITVSGGFVLRPNIYPNICWRRLQGGQTTLQNIHFWLLSHMQILWDKNKIGNNIWWGFRWTLRYVRNLIVVVFCWGNCGVLVKTINYIPLGVALCPLKKLIKYKHIFTIKNNFINMITKLWKISNTSSCASGNKYIFSAALGIF